MNGEALFARVYRAGVGGLPSGLEARAASAIDAAAWDIRGKAHGQPVVNHLASEILAHGIAAVPNGHIVGFYPWAQPLFSSPARIEEGYLCLPHAPGLGLELDEDAVARAALS
jgi:L-alanine-DL-glutamate epimerase-like enolase superfamily enzyme